MIQKGQEFKAFSPFISNPRDPLYFFNDGAFHASCFTSQDLAAEAQQRWEEGQSKTGPGNRFCVLCKAEVTRPEDYLCLGHLTSDPSNPLHRENYAQFHRECFRTWDKKEDLAQQLAGLAPEWDPSALQRVIEGLREA
ncbi:MAG: hypothetical protein D6731_17840 [Planctomycetota bacterium]|nr:MAG: hypothetical protein D6731_17840 [Planctomycetota bacterium]